MRGYTVFNYTGNCLACHYNGPQTGGAGAIFTDYTYENASPPRNPNMPANAASFRCRRITTWGCVPRSIRIPKVPQNEADLLCFLETLTDGYVQGVTPEDPNGVNWLRNRA